ncbi:hypothetical protein LOZ65_001341 [Ophidiomyces ophidiicola]|nr:hypothetical protein LOZ65_001341 [Ophidiomyces ophidiicola]
MSKRAQEDSPPDERRFKRARQSGAPDRISALSDELALHILSFLPTQSLLTCQSISRRFHILAGDSELWKRKYYLRWILPRNRRVPQLSGIGVLGEPTSYSSRVVRWLNHGRSWRAGREINWMKEYRLQHNWAKGICRVRELEVAQPPIPPVLVNLHDGIALTVDGRNGLRAFSLKDTETDLAHFKHPNALQHEQPTALTVCPDSISPDKFTVAVGFESGSFSLYTLDKIAKEIVCRVTGSRADDGEVTALASCPGYLLVLFGNKTVSLYRETSKPSLQLVDCLQTHNIRAPLTLSLRILATTVIASIAYSFLRIGNRWSVGLQELRWNEAGARLGSHLATPLDLHDLSSAGHAARASQPHHTRLSHISYSQPPTSLSYAHPYLVAGHGDNTLTMHLVVSTTDGLTISPPRRLWGHTSCVSGVRVGERGKTVSVSSRGDDMRIWELEDLVSSLWSLRARRSRERSIRVSVEPRPELLLCEVERRGGLTRREAAQMPRLVGFDDEQVVVLREQGRGAPLLDCYDFS